MKPKEVIEKCGLIRRLNLIDPCFFRNLMSENNLELRMKKTRKRLNITLSSYILRLPHQLKKASKRETNHRFPNNLIKDLRSNQV